jgi:nucleoside-diphosphate-sugar epimerase
VAQVLVTGGAGFIGSHLVRALAEGGQQVRVLDNLSSGKRAHLAGVEVEFLEGDILDGSLLARGMDEVEVVYHLAAMVGVAASVADPLGCYAINVTGSLNVLEAARRAGVSKVVLASSAAVYGAREGTVSETTPAHPLSPYGASKLAMEQIAQLYAELYQLPAVSLRYFNVYGPHQALDSPYAAVIPTFIQQLLEGRAPVIEGDGGQTRDFVFVGDIVRANLMAASADAFGEVFNIGNGVSTSIVDLAGLLARLIPGSGAPEHGPPRVGDIRHSTASVDRARMSLGFRPGTALKDGLEITVEWFRAVRQAPIS